MDAKKIIEKVNIIINNPKTKLMIYWSILGLIAIVLFVSFIYSDILITTKHSINLWQTIFNGDPLGFYAINKGLVVDRFLQVNTMAAYEFPIFIIFAIWNLPIWIAQNLLHIQITESLLCLFWLKSILLLFLGLSVLVMKKVCREINIDKKHISWVIFTFISSPIVLASLFIMSQYDIIVIFFMLLGIWMYIKGNFKWFIIWFAIAIPLKMFALFIFIPLLLLREKKVIQIIKYSFIGLIPLIFTKLLSSQMPMYKESTSGFNDEMLSRMFTSGVGVNFGNASFFCMGIIAVAIYCYCKTLKNKDERNRFGIYIPFLVMACFFAFVGYHPYWIILIMPFASIMFFQNMKYFKINILLDIVVSASFLITTILVYFWCYGPLVIERMAIPRLFGSTYNLTTKYPFVSSLLTELGAQKYMPFYLATFVVCLGAIAIINFPRNAKNLEIIEKPKIEWGLLFVRMLIIIPVPVLMIICYYYK